MTITAPTQQRICLQFSQNIQRVFVALTARHIFTSSRGTFIPIPLVISGQNISTFIPSTMTKLSIFFLSCSVLYVVYFWSSGVVLHIFVLIFKIRLIRLNAQIRGDGFEWRNIVHNLFISGPFCSSPLARAIAEWVALNNWQTDSERMAATRSLYEDCNKGLGAVLSSLLPHPLSVL